MNFCPQCGSPVHGHGPWICLPCDVSWRVAHRWLIWPRRIEYFKATPLRPRAQEGR